MSHTSEYDFLFKVPGRPPTSLKPLQPAAG